MRAGRRRRTANSALTALTLRRAGGAPAVPRTEHIGSSKGLRAVILGALAITTFTLRPNILGELLNAVGVGFVSLTALIMLAVERGRTEIARGSVVVVLLVSTAETWSVYRSAFTGTMSADSVRSSLFTVITVVAGTFALGPMWAGRWLLRFIVGVVLVLSASQVVTSLVLLVTGVPLGAYASFPVGQYVALVHPPFTIDVGQILLAGTNVERFAGLGREPGWMAMWAAFAWFVWPLVGRPRWWGRILLLAGVLAPISTAGFGVFVIVLAIEVITRPMAGHSPLFVYMRTLIATGLLAAAAWAALFAPVFGLAAKSTLTATSLDERNGATTAGLDALSRLSLGDVGSTGSINLVAAVAAHGWPYSLLMLLALLSPLLTARSPVHILPALLVIVLTLVLAQPIDGSPFPWLVVVALAGLVPRTRALSAHSTTPAPSEQPAAHEWRIDFTHLKG